MPRLLGAREARVTCLRDFARDALYVVCVCPTSVLLGVCVAREVCDVRLARMTKNPWFSLGLLAVHEQHFATFTLPLPLKYLVMMLRPSPRARLRPNHPSKH